MFKLLCSVALAYLATASMAAEVFVSGTYKDDKCAGPAQYLFTTGGPSGALACGFSEAFGENATTCDTSAVDGVYQSQLCTSGSTSGLLNNDVGNYVVAEAFSDSSCTKPLEDTKFYALLDTCVPTGNGEYIKATCDKVETCSDSSCTDCTSKAVDGGKCVDFSGTLDGQTAYVKVTCGSKSGASATQIAGVSVAGVALAAYALL